MLNKENNIFKCTKLTLFTAAKCNLNCEYCYMHQTSLYSDIDKEYVEAWESGQYLETVKAVFDRLGINPLQVREIDLWGGETLLHSNILAKSWKNLAEYCKNYNKVSTSSNWMINIEDYEAFVSQILLYANQPVRIQCQQSIDGPEGELMVHGHKGNWEVYMNNYRHLSNWLNTHHLDNLDKMGIVLKPTIETKRFIEFFSKKENCLQYLTYLYDKEKELLELFTSPKVSVAMVMPSLTSPVPCTSEDGRKFLYALQLYDEAIIDFSKSHNLEGNNLSFAAPLYYGCNLVGRDQLITAPTNGCWMQLNGLGITPDGTLADCTGTFMRHREDYYNHCIETGQEADAILSKMYRKYHFNPLKLTDEELEDIIWYQGTGLKYSRSQWLNLAVNMAQELALSGQIPFRYFTDRQAILQEVMIKGKYINCPRENLSATHAPLLTDFGSMRLWLNGATQKVLTDHIKPDHSIIGAVKIK